MSMEHHVNARLPQARMIAARECFLSFRGKVARRAEGPPVI